MSAVADAALAPWRRHNARLSCSSVLSIALAVVLWIGAVTPDGRDPWYGAIAIEFVIWGAINLGFAISGFRGVRIIRALPEAGRDEVAISKAREIARLLRVNRWLNALWLTAGAVLLLWGYHAWSASLVGHGVGVLVQAIVLTILDSVFERDLRDATGETGSSVADASGG